MSDGFNAQPYVIAHYAQGDAPKKKFSCAFYLLRPRGIGVRSSIRSPEMGFHLR